MRKKGTAKSNRSYVSYSRFRRASTDKTTTRMRQSQAWTIASGIIDAFRDRPFKVIVLYQPNSPLFFAVEKGIATDLRPPSAVILSKCNEYSVYTESPCYTKMSTSSTINGISTASNRWPAAKKCSKMIKMGSLYTGKEKFWFLKRTMSTKRKCFHRVGNWRHVEPILWLHQHGEALNSANIQRYTLGL